MQPEGYKIARAKVYQDKGVALPTDGDAWYTLSREYVIEGAAVVEGPVLE